MRIVGWWMAACMDWRVLGGWVIVGISKKPRRRLADALGFRGVECVVYCAWGARDEVALPADVGTDRWASGKDGGLGVTVDR